MASREDSAGRRSVSDRQPPKRRSIFVQQAVQRSGLLVAFLIAGFGVGIAYRVLFNAPAEATLANFARSGIHGAGVGLTVWLIQVGFVSIARSRAGAALRRLPLAAEVLAKSLIMTAALLAVGLALQALLYEEPYGLRWLTRKWLTTDLPRLVLIGFGLSLVLGALAELRRLIGGAMLLSVLLGTYRRPSRQHRIVMFLDLAHSTRLAESMGELRVHDLITRFFFDIDQPISDWRGVVHAYVGDEVIVTWPLTEDPTLNARCVACFFAIDDAIGRLAQVYEAEFGLIPEFRAGIHAGPLIVSECGDEKRQLALFGDTMNVGARLCDYCKSVNARLVVSGDLVRVTKIPDGLTVAEAVSVAARGREAPVEAHVVRRRLQRHDNRPSV